MKSNGRLSSLLLAVPRKTGALAHTVGFLALSPAAFANTWIVDQAGGPGHHFTDLPPAIAAAAPGDVLIVRPGNYSKFVLDKGLAILGESLSTTHVRWTTGLGPRIENVPAGELVLVAGVSFSSLSGSLTVSDCNGAVVLDHARTICAVNVDQSADVRLASATIAGVYVQDSHVEIVSTQLYGESPCCDGMPGEPGLQLRGASRVLLARSSAQGGDGGVGLPFFPGDGGDGAPAAQVQDLAELLIGGGGVALLQGGTGGASGGFGGTNGSSASALYNDASQVWRSGATFLGGGGAPPIQYVPGPGSFDIPVTPDDPTLELIGEAQPGASITLTTYAPPGTIVRLTLGGKPVVIPTPNIRVEQLTTRDRSVFLGVVPASGKISHVMVIPLNYQPGAKLFAQARVVDFSLGEVRRTNSVPIIVR